MTESPVRAALFPSPLGPCGLAWSASGIRALQLPEDSDRETLDRLRRRSGARADAGGGGPAWVLQIVARLQSHLRGEPDRLIDVSLDLDGTASSFALKVYAEARAVGPGQMITYAELARAAGRPGAARAVGGALAANPVPLIVPCHRVIAADGGLGGFSAGGQLTTKLRLLSLEGADLRAVARAGVRLLGRRDERLAEVIRRVGPYRLIEQQRGDHFTALIESIAHQQVSMKAGAAVFARLREQLGAGSGGRLDPARLLGTPLERLRAAGLSRQKAGYLHDLARCTVDGRLPLERIERLDDEQVIESLTQVRGIGRWSAEMFLMFRLGRLDVLPVGDLGLRKGAQRVYGLRELPSAASLRQLAQRWAPFRSVATWYLWRALDAGGL